jgi:hypothetical protein
MGSISLRTGGTTGGWKFLFGAWAEMDEDLLPLDVYRCASCKRVEFFDLVERPGYDDQRDDAL